MVIIVGLIIWNVMYVGLLLIVLIPAFIYLVITIRQFLYSAPHFVRFIAEDRAALHEAYSETLKLSLYYRINKKTPLLTKNFVLAANQLEKSVL